jgi:hypothetical protein
MAETWRLLFCAALAFSAGGNAPAFAQGGRAWVDPPADLASPSAPEIGTSEAPDFGQSPNAARSRGPRGTAPTRDRETLSRAEASRQLVIDYLAMWSMNNRVALEATMGFYAPRVIFHGRTLTPAALAEEKRRFLERWPERDYRARPDTIQVNCDRSGQSCTVRSKFDFRAQNPSRRRWSQGSGTLELVVIFPEGRLAIASETSLVHKRRRAIQGGPAEAEGTL